MAFVWLVGLLTTIIYFEYHLWFQLHKAVAKLETTSLKSCLLKLYNLCMCTQIHMCIQGTDRIAIISS